MCRTLITSPSCFVGISQVKSTKWHSIRETTSGLGFDLQVLADALNQHILILAAILLKGSQPIVGRRNSAWVALGGVTIYTELVGAEASVVKAAVMAALFIFATPLLRGIHWAGLLSSWTHNHSSTMSPPLRALVQRRYVFKGRKSTIRRDLGRGGEQLRPSASLARKCCGRMNWGQLRSCPMESRCGGKHNIREKRI